MLWEVTSLACGQPPPDWMFLMEDNQLQLCSDLLINPRFCPYTLPSLMAYIWERTANHWGRSSDQFYDCTSIISGLEKQSVAAQSAITITLSVRTLLIVLHSTFYLLPTISPPSCAPSFTPSKMRRDDGLLHYMNAIKGVANENR